MKFLISLLLYSILDSFWLTSSSFLRPDYNKLVNKIKGNFFQTILILIMYPLISLGLTTFILSQVTLNNAFFLGGILGLINYTTFNTTNYLLFKKMDISLKDTLIGIFITAFLAWLTVFISNLI